MIIACRRTRLLFALWPPRAACRRIEALAASLTVYQMADGNGTAVAAADVEIACASNNASEALIESVRSHAATTLGLLDETLLLVDGLAATIETAADDASTKLP